ncbi:MAG: hypothetical protein NVV63_18460 [Opitutus sp.]|nr:hypothetical protein [Opitutus sp.]
MRPLFFLLILAFVGCAKNDRVLSLADISRPTREMLDAEVRVRGFIFFHVEETLLCPKNEYGSAPFIQLSLLPSMRPAPDKEKKFCPGLRRARSCCAWRAQSWTIRRARASDGLRGSERH